VQRALKRIHGALYAHLLRPPAAGVAVGALR
jgi:hypothetical protein